MPPRRPPPRSRSPSRSASPRPIPERPKPRRVVSPEPEASGSGGFAVQLAAPGSESDAKATSSRLAKKFAGPLGGHHLGFHKAESNGQVGVPGACQQPEQARCGEPLREAQGRRRQLLRRQELRPRSSVDDPCLRLRLSRHGSRPRRASLPSGGGASWRDPLQAQHRRSHAGVGADERDTRRARP